MSNVRAEILAASRSRTGWQRQTSLTSPSKPIIESLRKSFEDKVTPSICDDAKGKEGTRKMGAKVSAIALIFQSMAPASLVDTSKNLDSKISHLSSKLGDKIKLTSDMKKSSLSEKSKSIKENNLINSKSKITLQTPQNKDSNSQLNYSSKLSKSEEKAFPTEVSRLPRTESRVSRFNNAKAFFEKSVTSESSSKNDNLVNLNGAANNNKINSSEVIQPKFINNQSSTKVFKNSKMSETTASKVQTSPPLPERSESRRKTQSDDQLQNQQVLKDKALNSAQAVKRVDDNNKSQVFKKPENAIKTSETIFEKKSVILENTKSASDSDQINKLAESGLIDKMINKIAESNNVADCSFLEKDDLNNCDTSGLSNISNLDECLKDVEMMTEEEAAKLLSRKSWSSLNEAQMLPVTKSSESIDQEEQETGFCNDASNLTSEKKETVNEGSLEVVDDNPATDLNSTFESSFSQPNCIIFENEKYYILEDGHYFTEREGLAEESEEDESSSNIFSKKKTKVKFSNKPIRVYSTYAVDEYDRRNEDMDIIAASAEYELEKRIEKMDVFPIEFEKGSERLGISIIGMGVGADAGLEKLGIFVKSIDGTGAAAKDGR